MSLTPFDSIVWSMNLSPSFFKKQHPKLVSLSTGKNWFLPLAWNEIIHDNLNLFSIFGERNMINSLLVDFIFISEYFFDSLTIVILSKRTDHWEHVAIGQLALRDVVWSWIINKDLELTVVISEAWNLASSNPFKLVILFIPYVWFADWILCWREDIVLPLLVAAFLFDVLKILLFER